MNDDEIREDGPTRDGPDPLLGRIRAAMEDYEGAFGRDERPKIEDLAMGLEPRDRDRMVLELLALEVELRRKAGEDPRPRDYEARFPDPPGLIHEAFELAEATRSFRAGNLAGGRLGKFEIRRTLGEGGQASTYLARDASLERFVVLKVYRSTGDPSRIERAHAEGRNLCRVNSPFVTRCHSLETLDGRIFLVLEYVEGPTLESVGKLPPWRAAAVVRHVARGVEAIHAADVVHGDLKPHNIVLGDDGRPRIIDFGLSDLAGRGATGVTRGSPHYMAPEQCDDTVAIIGRKTDVFGLGAVLYHALTGDPPYPGGRDEALEKARSRDLRPPRELNSRIPRSLERVCREAMAAEPEQRYPSARAMGRALILARVPWRSAAAVMVLAAVMVGLWDRGLRPTGATPPDQAIALGRSPILPAPPLRIESLEVKHFRGNPSKFIGTIGELSHSTRVDDNVRVERPAERPGVLLPDRLESGRLGAGLPQVPGIEPPRAGRRDRLSGRGRPLLRPDRRHRPPGVRAGRLAAAAPRVQAMDRAAGPSVAADVRRGCVAV